MIDLGEANGAKIDMVIPIKFPAYGVRHEKKVLWICHQHRAAYDLYHHAAYSGFGTIENGDAMRDAIVRFDNVTLKEAVATYTLSKTVSDRLRKFNGFDSVPLYQPPPLEGRYYCADYGDYILSVGRLDPLKRVDLAVRALCHCDKQIRLKIAGTGAEQENLKKLAHALKVDGRVEFLGFVDDGALLELYANAFAVFFAPVDEDYGYVTLEAFLSGKPVVTCFDSGGVLEFAKEEENALIRQSEPQSVGEACGRLFADKNLCRDMGHSGRECLAGITWDAVIDTLTKFI
jgi:glycosyltransferase involved in cell wall biosynthesis